ncbi:MAG: GGDEF domain-containing protein [Proteobacteria bacterium]|nr:GGDEF domain-containing protein [Pseudomonadota bacterium]
MVAESVDHVRRITAFASLPGTQARLVVGLDESEVLRDIGRETNIAYLQLALIALVILFGAWFGGERLIVEPIRELARMSTRIGRGEAGLGPRRRAWAAEFAPLAAALDDMAGKLAKRENDLRSANRHLEELASIDSLSGLANRRSFDARLEAEWRRARVTGEPVSLLMIDVDHFKLFNDTYGHLSGDHCLRLVGETIMAAAGRSSDFAARYGGEEFTLLLPGAPADKAIDIAEALRCAIVERNITNAAAPAKLVTVSIGVGSLYPAGDDNAQTLIEAADAGLYNAKRRGRNAVVVHGQVEILQAG